MKVNLGEFEITISMGPGQRACLWVRGCSLHCLGCTSPHFISSRKKSFIDVKKILEWILEAKNKQNIEGVSFSGGEPFEQAEALALIAKESRALGLSTISWSGYTRSELESEKAPAHSRSFLNELDVLIDGRFDQSKLAEGLPHRGSSNQKIHCLTDRYQPTDFQKSSVTFILDKNGAQGIGVVPYEHLQYVLRLIGDLL